MAKYLEISSRIYGIYLKHVSPDDIHVYSIDEVFIDATQYLRMYAVTAKDFAMRLIREVLSATGITATAGIGPNLYLAKIAMDIIAKHIPADSNGVRIAELDEAGYRRQLWGHRPMTDFWRVGHGSVERLESNGMYTMGDVARMSIANEELLYRLFGVNAELLIDHAWGWEPCTIAAIKSYRPENNSLSSGQVLQEPYNWTKGRLVVREMADLLSLDLVDKRLVTDQMELTVGYDVENLADLERRRRYDGPVRVNHYGKPVPKEAHGSISLGQMTSSTRAIVTAVTQLYDRIVDKELLVRRMYVVANHIVDESQARGGGRPVQLELFTDCNASAQQQARAEAERDREKRQQQAVIAIKKSLGKNAIIKAMNLDEGSTARERNRQIGGHRA